MNRLEDSVEVTCFRGGLSLYVVTAMQLCVGCSTYSQPDDKVHRWAEQVLLGKEYEDEHERCVRWVKSPTLSVFGATAQEKIVVAESVAHLNRILDDTRIEQLTIIEPDDEEANILVYFAPLNQFPSLATRHGFKYVQGNWGFFYLFWNARNEIDQAIVLLASDKLKGERLRHMALEEIAQTLGIPNDSPVFPDSIFYENGTNGGEAQKLSERDKTLVTFLYNNIDPGANKLELQAALRKYWPKQ